MITKKTPRRSLPASFTIAFPAVIFFGVLLVATSILAGVGWSKYHHNFTAVATPVTTATATFEPQKSSQPTFKFFVMSFCPYGNQMEEILRPVFDLLAKKINFEPHYIFNKVDNLTTYCKSAAGDPTQCDLYVQNKYFTTVAECQKTVTANLAECQNESSYIKADNGALYTSLHGRQEATQDVREICAYQQSDDKSKFWNFMANVNKNCTAQNADSCWTQQAKEAGLDTDKITECFNKDGINLIEQEIAQTTKYNVSGSPTLIVNDSNFPPEAAYTQDSKGSLKIGKKVFTQDQYRTPEVIKSAICAAFSREPKECQTALASAATTTTTGSAAAGCGQ